MNDTLTFGAWLKQRMEALGLSVLALATQIDRCSVAVFRWRNGSHFPPGTLHDALAKALEVPASEIRLRIARDRRAGHAPGSTTSVPA